MPDAKPFRPTPTQQSALDYMRARHDGRMETGDGFSVTTAEVLEREGLCTVEKSRRADGVLRGSLHKYFEATLTEKGWEGHERPAKPGPAHGVPTPAAELHEGDKVINIHTGGEGIWHGPNALGSYTVYSMGTPIHIADGNYRLLERAPEVEETPEPQPPVSAPEESDVPLDRERPVPHAVSPSGTRYEPGMRVTLRTGDGMWRHGEVTEVYQAAHTREPHLRFTCDAYQVAPPRRPQRHMANGPGKRRADNGRTITAAVDDKDLSPERFA